MDAFGGGRRVRGFTEGAALANPRPAAHQLKEAMGEVHQGALVREVELVRVAEELVENLAALARGEPDVVAVRPQALPLVDEGELHRGHRLRRRRRDGVQADPHRIEEHAVRDRPRLREVVDVPVAQVMPERRQRGDAGRIRLGALVGRRNPRAGRCPQVEQALQVLRRERRIALVNRGAVSRRVGRQDLAAQVCRLAAIRIPHHQLDGLHQVAGPPGFACALLEFDDGERLHMLRCKAMRYIRQACCTGLSPQRHSACESGRTT